MIKNIFYIFALQRYVISTVYSMISPEVFRLFSKKLPFCIKEFWGLFVPRGLFVDPLQFVCTLRFGCPQLRPCSELSFFPMFAMFLFCHFPDELKTNHKIKNTSRVWVYINDHHFTSQCPLHAVLQCTLSSLLCFGSLVWLLPKTSIPAVSFLSQKNFHIQE